MDLERIVGVGKRLLGVGEYYFFIYNLNYFSNYFVEKEYDTFYLISLVFFSVDGIVRAYSGKNVFSTKKDEDLKEKKRILELEEKERMNKIN